MTTDWNVDFVLPSSRFNTDYRSNIPFGWSCDWAYFEGRHRLSPCVDGRIILNPTLEGLYNVHGELFFVMYEIKSPIAIIRTSRDDTQYYIFDVDTCDLFRFTNTYPTLQHFMEKAECWTGGGGRLNSVTPFEPMDFELGTKEVAELIGEWNTAFRAAVLKGLRPSL